MVGLARELALCFATAEATLKLAALPSGASSVSRFGELAGTEASLKIAGCAKG